MRDVQSEIIAEVIARLAAVPSFGAQVFEDSVVRLLDADDDGLPDDFIVIQERSIEELERVPRQAKERLVLYIVPMTKRRDFAAELRRARLSIKSILAGHKGGLDTPNVVSLSFIAEEMRAPAPGRRLAGRSLQVQIDYTQQYS